MAELASAVLGAVVGVCGTYILDFRRTRAEVVQAQREASEERRRNRRAIATALLYDLKQLESDLYQLFGSETPTSTAASYPALYYDALRAETRWFSPDSIQPVAEFFRQAAFAFNTLLVIRDRGIRSKNQAEQEHHVRCLMGFALQQLPAAAEALKREGGIPPEAGLHTLVTYPNLPKVPRPLFPDIRRDAEHFDAGEE